MNEYLKSVQEFYNIYGNYIDKYVDRSEKDKNHGLMIQTAGEYYEMFQEVLQKDGSNEFLEKSCDKFLKFQDLVMEHKTEDVKNFYKDFENFLVEEQNKNKQQELIAAIFDADMAQMKLQNEKLSKCQELLEHDMNMYGAASDTTKAILEVQHMEIVSGQVQEKINEYIDRNKANQEIEKAVKSQEKEIPETKKVKKTYQATAYLKKTTDKPIVLYGNDSQELLAKLQKWNETREDDMKFYSCYMRSLNPETSKYENSVKYEVATGKDITPIHLELPKMKRDEFLEVVAQLKTDGAKFYSNSTGKGFYITPDQDMEKFSKYIPQGFKSLHAQPSKEKEDKPSVRKQLEQNKAKLEEQDRKPREREQEKGLG